MPTIIPSPHGEQDESFNHHEQQNRWHDTLRQLGAATYALNIVTTEAEEHRKCVGGATQTALMLRKQHRERNHMPFSVETELDGTTLVVRIPMRFQRRRGRKRIVAPDGSELAPATKPQPDGTLVKALARAWRWQKMLDDGVYTTISEMADAEGINRSYVSRILRLALLAPDIVEAILNGRKAQEPMLETFERPLPASWEEQRGRLLADSAAPC